MLNSTDLSDMVTLPAAYAQHGIDGLAFRAYEMNFSARNSPVDIAGRPQPSVRVTFSSGQTDGESTFAHREGVTDVPITYRDGRFVPKWNEARTTVYHPLDDDHLPRGEYPSHIEPDVERLVAFVNEKLTAGIPLLEERLQDLNKYGTFKTGIVELARAHATVKLCSKRTLTTQNEHGSINVHPGMDGNKTSFSGAYDGPISEPFRASTFSANVDPETRKITSIWVNGPASKENITSLIEQLIQENRTASSVIDATHVIAMQRQAEIIEKFQRALPDIQTAMQDLKQHGMTHNNERTPQLMR